MNSDPYDSAAWRTFGMLDADESAIFDQAMRHDPVLRGAYLEMDRLSAAIAASTAAPIEPRTGQLERLQNRLGLYPSRRAYLWLGVSGWAAAAAVTLVLFLDRNTPDKTNGGSATASGTSSRPSDHSAAPARNAASPDETAPGLPQQANKTPDLTPKATPVPGNETEAIAAAKLENKRLYQEIEVLRENLEKFQIRDRILFQATPGVSLPIVMTMSPPGLAAEDSTALTKNDDHPAITAMLGDALTARTTTTTAATEVAPPIAVRTPQENTPVVATHPSAVPIYDAARDSGTLVVSNLPPAEEGAVYNLWVTTEAGARPVYVGSLPERSAAGADSFDFSLGSTTTLPSGFLLTKDPQDTPASPTSANIILQGPPTPPK
jgi:hypothetical protein